jgi:multidrug efflux system membrane fusion protein
MSPRRATGTVFLFSAVLLAACEPQPTAEPEGLAVRPVRVAAVAEQEGVRELRVSSVTRATQRATLAFLVSGTLTERPIDVGQRVEVGDELARLYNPSLEPAVESGAARVRELDARLEQLRRDVRRAENLHDRNLISVEDVEKVRTEHAATRAARDLAVANLWEARNQRDQAAINAPFDGAVNAVYFEVGEFVAAGQPVLQVSGTDELEAAFDIPETLIGRFAPGQEVTLELPFLDGRAVSGQVIHVGDAGGRPGDLFPVEVRMRQGEGLRPGLTVELVLPTAAGPGLVIPLAAVLDPGAGRPRVFRVTGGRVEPVFVQIGQLLDDRVEVRGALSAGDEIVVTGVSGLTPGQRVEVLR